MKPSAPEALILIAPGCPHCPVVLEGLTVLVKEAVLGRLEVVNIAAEPERARLLGVRSVPWTRLGPFELEGLYSAAELRHWAEMAGTPEGMSDYFEHLLTTGRRVKVEAMVRGYPTHLPALVGLLGHEATGIDARLGVIATLEELKGTGLAIPLVDTLGGLTRHTNPRVRGDACHALSLSESTHALPYLRACLDDRDPDVREAATEALEALEE